MDGFYNRMCLDCTERGKSCSGTTCQTWTGCVYRKGRTDIDNSIIPILSREALTEKGVLISAIASHGRRPS